MAYMETTVALVQHARDDGYRVLLVYETLAHALSGLTDLEGRPMIDLAAVELSRSVVTPSPLVLGRPGTGKPGRFPAQRTERMTG